MKYKILAISTLACLVSFSSLAKLGDLKQEVKITSSSQEADIKNNQIIFYGPVEVTQGSIKLQASQLRVFSKTGNSGKILVATGKPATYTQIMDDGRPADASANTIRYELSNRTLTLIGHASLSQAGSKVTGHKIRYNLAEQKLIAESSGTDKVVTIIQPESYQDSSNAMLMEPKQSIDKDHQSKPKSASAEPKAEVEAVTEKSERMPTPDGSDTLPPSVTEQELK